MEPYSQKVLHVVYGSNSVRGLYHKNEDRYSAAISHHWPTLHPKTPSPDARAFPCEGESCPKLLHLDPLDVHLPQTAGQRRSADSHHNDAVQGCGMTGCTAIHVDRESAARIAMERAFIFTVCDGHDSCTAADFVSLEAAQALQKAWHRRLSHTLKVMSGEQSSAAPISPIPGAHPTLSQSWQTGISSMTRELGGEHRRAQGAFHKAFKEVEAGFRSYTEALSAEHATPECTSGQSFRLNQLDLLCCSGTCVICTLILGTTVSCAGLGDCRAGFLTLDLVPETSPKSSNSGKLNPSVEKNSLDGDSCLHFNLSAAPICKEETIPSLEIFQRSVAGDTDIPPHCDIDETVVHSRRMVRQATKVTDTMPNVSGALRIEVQKDESIEFNAPIGGGDRRSTRLLSPGSNDSMVVCTPLSTPASLTPNSLPDAEASSTLAENEEEMVVTDSDDQAKEKKIEQAARLLEAVTSALNAFTYAQRIPPAKSKIIQLKNVQTDLCTMGDGIVPKFTIRWLNTQHRLSNPEELRRVKMLGGTVEHNRISGLEPSRTIGDFDVKALQPPGVLSTIPQVTALDIENPGLLFIASDGIWDSFNGDILLRLLKKKKKLWLRILRWLSQPTGDDMTSPEELQTKEKKKGNQTYLDCYPSGKELSQIASLLTKEGRAHGGDDCTCFVVYMCPARTSSSVAVCGCCQ